MRILSDVYFLQLLARMFLSYPLLYIYNVGLVSGKFSIFHCKADFSVLV